MDAFKLRDRVVADYSDYIQSFLNITDPDIGAFVDEALASGLLWPDALLQLSPSYQSAQTVDDLVEAGVLHPLCGEIFRLGDKSLSLHQHQYDAIEAARKGHSYVVTTGTGSGKTKTR